MERRGGGYRGLVRRCASEDTPCISPRAFAKLSKKVGSSLEVLCGETEARAREEEIALALAAGEKVIDGCVSTAASLDGAWLKRSYGHSYNSLLGLGSVVGAYSRKTLDHATYKKQCFTCAAAKRRGIPPSPHDCKKNHDGSAKSMEPKSALDMFTRAPSKGLRYTILVGFVGFCIEK
eukprot:Lithocolla_globosa_v1_NODE_7679_length_915_cov_5.501163.p1 type:complete len:178 gc:universal NODE_7679_length_915_cov_5.501163:83-616(+)